MQEYIPTDDLKSLFQRFREIGGKVDYVLIENDLNVDEELLHRITALFGMKVLQGRLAELELYSEKDSTNPVPDFQPLVIFPLVRRSKMETISIFLQDYWHLFSQPPYGLHRRNIASGEFSRMPEGEVQELFSQTNLLIFGEFSNWSAKRWSTDWSNYFLANTEEEKGYLWTLISNSGSHCVWIGCRSDRFVID
jgi:hypothetical protein